MVSSSTDFTLDFSSTGADYVWDFSAVSVDNQRIDTFHSVLESSIPVIALFGNPFDSQYYSDYYNNADAISFGALPISAGNTVAFTKYASSEVRKVGIAMTISGIEVPSKALEIDTEYDLPLAYGNTWTGTYFLDIDLNPAYDAIFRRHQDRSSEVDGWGTITTPFGTFDAVRVKSDLSFNDSIYLDFIGWQALPTPDQHEYTWWTNDQKIPIMKIVTTGGGAEVITKVEFKDKDRNLASVANETLVEFSVYPNPASESVQISAQNLEAITIVDASGRIVHNQSQLSPVHLVDVKNWDAGMYVIQASTGNSISTERLIIR